jgi:uncharacterized protein YndB with AHSA1/START domain
MPGQASQGEKIIIRKIISASREKVFKAWTDPESIRHWMCPGDIRETEAHLDVRPGGSFRITMKGPNMDYEHTGTYRIVEPPSRLVFTWISTKGTHDQETIVTVQLEARGNQCELTLTHEKLPDRESIRSHRRGWGEIVDLLDESFGK